MTEKTGKKPPAPPGRSAAEARKAKLAGALRDNLKRRKQASAAGKSGEKPGNKADAEG